MLGILKSTALFALKVAITAPFRDASCDLDIIQDRLKKGRYVVYETDRRLDHQETELHLEEVYKTVYCFILNPITKKYL